MSRIIGHTDTVSALERELPPVTLLTGPPSVGKWTLAQHLANHHRVGQVDRANFPDGLTADAARAVISFVSRAPFGPFKLVLARLDGTSDAALNALLKTLEEPPATARFLLTSNVSSTGRSFLPPTVISRTHRFRLGLLSTGEVADVLATTGMSPTAAAKAAPWGRGQIQPAITAAQTGDGPRTTVLALARALGTGDRDLYERTFRAGFDEPTRRMLTHWLIEAITGQWVTFSVADTFGQHTDPERLRAMLTAISRVAYASPRLGIRAALEPFLTPA